VQASWGTPADEGAAVGTSPTDPESMRCTGGGMGGNPGGALAASRGQRQEEQAHPDSKRGVRTPAHFYGPAPRHVVAAYLGHSSTVFGPGGRAVPRSPGGKGSGTGSPICGGGGIGRYPDLPRAVLLEGGGDELESC